MKNFIAVKCFDETNIHAKGNQDWGYATLCGLDGDDDNMLVQQSVVPLPENPKIDCESCKRLIRIARNYREKDFC